MHVLMYLFIHIVRVGEIEGGRGNGEEGGVLALFANVHKDEDDDEALGMFRFTFLSGRRSGDAVGNDGWGGWPTALEASPWRWRRRNFFLVQ